MLSMVMKKYLRAARRWPAFFSVFSWILKKPILLFLNAVSYIRGFSLPHDPYLPPHKITMILGVYERETVNLCQKLITPGMVVVDGGAHAGYFTRLFSKYTGPTGKVVAFEPHPKNVAVLQKNLSSPKYQNVITIQKAIGNSESIATFYESEGSVGHSLHTASFRNGGIAVAVTSLDVELPKHGISSVDFIKLDVEGNEIEALHGMKKILEHSPLISIILEYRKDNTNISAKDLYESLLAHKLNVFIITDTTLERVRSPETIAAHTKCNLLATKGHLAEL